MGITKAKIALAIGVLGTLYGAYEGYDFTTGEAEKLERQRQNREKEVESLRGEVDKVKHFADNIQTIKREFRELNLQLEAVLEHMPRAFNLSNLLKSLTMLAENSGVEISAFRPKKTEDKEPNSFYASTTVDFNVKGTFTQTVVFFDQLSRLKRIINVESVKIVAGNEKMIKSSGVDSDTAVTVRTYRLAE